jgi:hypothetical protein
MRPPSTSPCVRSVRAEVGAVEDVVAEHERDLLVADELLADDERLRETVRRWLHRVLRRCRARCRHPALLELALVIRCRDHLRISDARLHEGRQRVVDHRLVVDRHQLLRDALGDGPQPGAGAAGQDDSAHVSQLSDRLQGVVETPACQSQVGSRPCCGRLIEAGASVSLGESSGAPGLLGKYEGDPRVERVDAVLAGRLVDIRSPGSSRSRHPSARRMRARGPSAR